MRKEFIADDELRAKLREAGIESLEEVKDVRLEADGALSVIKRKKQSKFPCAVKHHAIAAITSQQ